MRKSNVFLLYLDLNIILLLVMFAHMSIRRQRDRESIEEKERMVRRFELTNLEASGVTQLSPNKQVIEGRDLCHCYF